MRAQGLINHFAPHLPDVLPKGGIGPTAGRGSFSDANCFGGKAKGLARCQGQG